MLRTAPSEVVKARIILLEAVPCTYSARRQARTSTGRRNLRDARRNFRLRYLTESDTMRRGTNVKHVVSLIVPRRFRHRNSRSSSRSARGRWGPAPDMSCGLSVERFAVLRFMWFDQAGWKGLLTSIRQRFFRLPLRSTRHSAFTMRRYFRGFRRINDGPSNAAASGLSWLKET